MYSMISSCPNCGAGIFIPSVWHGITPPPMSYTCSCVPQPKVITTTTIDILPTNNGRQMSKALKTLQDELEKEAILKPSLITIEDLVTKIESIEADLEHISRTLEKLTLTLGETTKKLLKD